MARPEFKASNKQRHNVMLYRAFGMSNQSIAVGLGIDEKTLTKHFTWELVHGPSVIRQELMAAVASRVLSGKNQR